jgi:hypothetical protein
MFMCVVHQKSVINLDLAWKQSFLITAYNATVFNYLFKQVYNVSFSGLNNNENYKRNLSFTNVVK